MYRRGLDSERELRNRLWEIGRPGASRSQENEGLRRQVAKATERSGSRGVGQSSMGVSRLTSQRFGGRGDVGGTEWKRRDLGEGGGFQGRERWACGGRDSKTQPLIAIIKLVGRYRCCFRFWGSRIFKGESGRCKHSRERSKLGAVVVEYRYVVRVEAAR